MKGYYVDLHIHIGRSPNGRPVKITGSKNLTIENILEEASERKGLDMIGVIDCQVPEVLLYLRQLIKEGHAEELSQGGIRYKNVTLLLGSEIEIYDDNCHAPIHVLCYLPTLDTMTDFSRWLTHYMKNITLSTQRFKGKGKELQEKVKELSGLFIPAHVFTPFKSLYGTGVKKSLSEVFHPHLIDAIELGLSSDTSMADQIEELHSYTFVTNSDAHSLAKIAREYQEIKLDYPSFNDLKLALENVNGREVITNYGLDPRLGKYHRTCCSTCFTVLSHHVEGRSCPNCGERRVIKGVYDRLLELRSNKKSERHRPPYIHQVPLDFIPKLGPKTLEKLLNYFGTEMAILHRVPEKEIATVVGESIAALIQKARQGEMDLQTGGAGKYGKVKN